VFNRVTLREFTTAIQGIRNNIDFTTEAIEILFEFLEESEESEGNEHEFFPLDICILYSETDTKDTIMLAEDYGLDWTDRVIGETANGYILAN